MPFPEVQRVIYGKNPLIEVVFQVRFPRFLTIETEPPSEFQKLLISDFPIYEQRKVFQFTVSSGPTDRSETHGIIHAFLTPDRIHTIMLASDSLAVSCARYERWENFVKLISRMLTAFHQTYRLPIFTRVGLRYVDVINRENLGLADRAWKELLQPHIAGDFLGSSFSEDAFLAKTTVVTMQLTDSDQLLFRHGLVTQTETKKIAYLIDSDFYNEEQRNAELDATLAVANRLHTNSGRLFKWCISDVLHSAMEPANA
jgi:uncharacterized protein (TIGR04255 family)